MLMLHHRVPTRSQLHRKRQQFLAPALRLVSDPQLKGIAIVDRRRDLPKHLAAGPNGFVARGSKVGKLQTAVIEHRLAVVRMEEIARQLVTRSHWAHRSTAKCWKLFLCQVSCNEHPFRRCARSACLPPPIATADCPLASG